MTIGVPKCGVMAIGKPVFQRRLEANPLQVSGVPVPTVRQYRYLGVEVHYLELAHPTIVENSAKGRKVLAGLRPFLGNSFIPLHIRILAAKALLVPVLTWGGEVFGLRDRKALRPMERVYAECMRALFSVSSSTDNLTALFMHAVDLGVKN